MKIRKKQYAAAAVIVVGLILVFAGENSGSGLIQGLGVLLIAAGVAASWLVTRSPFCGSYLGKYYSPGNYCPACGKKVE